MRRIITLVLIGSVIMGAPYRALACSCATASLSDHLDASSVAFVGVVDSTIESAALFDVEKIFKGDPSQSVSVATDGACSVPFDTGTRYVVFATGDVNTLHTNLCLGTSEDVATAESSLKVIRTFAPRPHSISPTSLALPLPPPSKQGARTMPIAFAVMLLIGCAAGLVRYRFERPTQR